MKRIHFAALLLILGGLYPSEEATAFAVSGESKVQTYQNAGAGQPEKVARFEGPEKTSKPWRLCAVLPNVSDSYWDWVVEGLRQEASKLGAEIVIFEASGYDKSGLDQQRRLITSRCIAGQYDAILLSAIDDRGLSEPLDAARRANIPVIDLINGYEDARVAAHAMVDFSHMGRLAGQAVNELAEAHRKKAKGDKLKVLWVPGPDTAAWTRRGNDGFCKTLASADVELVTVYGPPFERVQAQLLRELWEKSGPFDVVVGTAPTAVAAAAMRTSGLMAPDTPILSYYATPTVMELFASGKITAVSTDEPTLQARIGVALAVMLLEGQPVPHMVGPIPRMMRHAGE